MPGWDTPQSAGQSKSNSNSNTGRDTGSDYGQFDRAVSQAANNPPASQPSGGDGLIDPGFHPELANIQDQALRNALAASDDAAYGRGEITDTTYNKDGTFTYDQTGGVIEASKYQTANLKAYLDSDIPSDKQKADALNRLSAIANSDLVGSKLRGVDDETGDFVLDNLDQAFANLENDPEYYEYVSQINKVPDQTFLNDLQENPIGTVVKSGGLMGTMIKGTVDQYQNNKALELLGYTGKVIKEGSLGGGDGGLLGSEDYLLGKTETGADVNEAITRLPGLIGGNELPPSVYDTFFSNISKAGENIMNQYNLAKAKTNNFITTPLTNASYGIFEEARQKGLI
jgi:hypothetical protein